MAAQKLIGILQADGDQFPGHLRIKEVGQPNAISGGFVRVSGTNAPPGCPDCKFATSLLLGRI